MARSSVDLPEPLRPTMPMASPWWATKETPRDGVDLLHLRPALALEEAHEGVGRVALLASAAAP